MGGILSKEGLGWLVASLLLLMLPAVGSAAAESDRDLRKIKAFRSLHFGDTRPYVQEKIAADPKLLNRLERVEEWLGLSMQELRRRWERSIGSKQLTQWLFESGDAWFQLGDGFYPVSFEYCEGRLCVVRLEASPSESDSVPEESVLRQRDFFVEVITTRYRETTRIKPLKSPVALVDGVYWSHVWEPAELDQPKVIRIGVEKSGNELKAVLRIEFPILIEREWKHRQERKQKLIDEAARSF